MPSPGASARRYAQAAFEIARERDTMDAWVGDLEALAEAAAQEGFSELVESPKLSIEQKREVLARILPALSAEGLNLATLLVAKGRLAALAAPVAREFHRLLDEHRGIVRAEVVTAVDADQAERDRIEQWLADVTGKEVRLEYRTDASLVGGMVVKIGDRVVDGSVRSKLNTLRRTLHEGAA